MIRRFVSLCAAATVIAAPAGHAQTAAEHIQLGNRDIAARHATDALKHYEAALASEPKNAEALWRAASAQVDLGEFEANAARRKALFATAEQRARLAVAAAPDNAEAHFVLARALGRTALTLGVRDRIKYAGVVRDEALACLKLAPTHAGCEHVLGVWNAEVMRLNGFSRMMAKNFLGGAVFGKASWGEARRYLESAVTHDPRRVVHRLDLARVYADMELKDRARTQYEAVIKGELIDYNDPHYKDAAAAELRKL